MTAPKQEAKKVIDSLPEDTSYDEILKELEGILGTKIAVVWEHRD